MGWIPLDIFEDMDESEQELLGCQTGEFCLHQGDYKIIVEKDDEGWTWDIRWWDNESAQHCVGFFPTFMDCINNMKKESDR